MKEIIAEYGTTVIHVTHDFEDIFALARHVAVMREGRIVQFGTPEKFFSRPNDEFVASFVGTNLLHGKVVGRKGGLTVVKVGNAVLYAADEAEGDVMLSLRPEEVILVRELGESSAQNVVPVKVESMERRGHFVWLTLSSDGFSLCAVVTPNAMEFLGIRPGKKFYALFKASALRVIK